MLSDVTLTWLVCGSAVDPDSIPCFALSDGLRFTWVSFYTRSHRMACSWIFFCVSPDCCQSVADFLTRTSSLMSRNQLERFLRRSSAAYRSLLLEELISKGGILAPCTEIGSPDPLLHVFAPTQPPSTQLSCLHTCRKGCCCHRRLNYAAMQDELDTE